MAFNNVAVLSLALALIFFSSAPGLSGGRKWKLEKNNFYSMLSTGEYEVMGEEDNNNRDLSQPWVAYPQVPAPSVEAFMPASPGHTPGVGQPVHPPTSTGGKQEVVMAEEYNDDHDFLEQPHVVKSPALAPTKEAISPTVQMIVMETDTHYILQVMIKLQHLDQQVLIIVLELDISYLP
ncbi:hypothetical protein ACJRO7_021194 [Eucalyptus globulus]|uniref:Uncharacterized protein n=1 Tax=Eucalyptus globulus TaxID=34317 RepID=A0ABD3KKJ9_EUCGL